LIINTIKYTLAAILGFLTVAGCRTATVVASQPADTVKTERKVPSEDYVTGPSLKYSDVDYANFLGAAQLHIKDSPLLPPFIELRSGQSLQLEFDDLRAGAKNYQYKVVHCDFYWQPSDLVASDYVQGFDELQIDDFEYSFNTKQAFTHYEAVFPNDMLQFKLSGNYVVVVSDIDQPEVPILSRRFVVFEQLVRYKPNVKASTIIADRRYRQEVDFEVVTMNYPVDRPYQDFHVAILQNQRWDNAITDLKPVFVKDQTLIYDFDRENNFDGGNEFRYADLKDMRYVPLGTDSIREEKDGWHVYLAPDFPRPYEVYRTLGDINGQYLIKNDRYDDKLESDYIYLHFILPFDFAFSDAGVYVMGEFNNWNCTAENRMHWDSKRKAYTARLYLKQGFYNYAYGIQRGADPVDLTIMEGNHQETENNYTVFSYYADGAGYDRVVGALFTNSFND
jgi:hypothetical protein